MRIAISLVLVIAIALGCSEYNAKAALSSKGYAFNAESWHLAIDKGDIDAMRLFVAAKYDLHSHDGVAAVSRAIAKRRYELLDFLLANGADANADLGDGRSHLYHAVMLCDTTTVNRLIAAGANVSKKDAKGATPIAYAYFNSGKVSYRCTKVVDLLKSHHAACEAPAPLRVGDTTFDVETAVCY